MLLLGLSYRENVKEDAFSTAHLLMAELKQRGATVLLNDPLWSDDELAKHSDGAEPISDIYAANADALIIQAYHEQYKTMLDWPKLAAVGCHVVLDGRNALRSQKQTIEAAGLKYIGVGQSARGDQVCC